MAIGGSRAETLGRSVLSRLPGRVARYGHAWLRRGTIRRIARDRHPLALLATHDLSRSGAPLLVVQIAQLLRDAGNTAVVMSPVDGPFAADLRADGIEVIVDPRLFAGPVWLDALASHAAVLVANTVETAPLVARLGRTVPALWYLHEVSLLTNRLPRADVRAALAVAKTVWAGSPMCADLVRPIRADVAVVPYGVSPVPDGRPVATTGRLVVGVFGSIEPRKGQDFVTVAAPALPPEVSVRLYGRVLDRPFADRVLANLPPNVEYRGEVDLEGYRAALTDVDAVLVSSRDDTLPLVSIDALGAGRLLLLLPSVGTSAWLSDGRDAFIGDETSAAGVLKVIERAIAHRADAATIAAAAHETFAREFSIAAFRDRLLAAVA